VYNQVIVLHLPIKGILVFIYLFNLVIIDNMFMLQIYFEEVFYSFIACIQMNLCLHYFNSFPF